MTLSRAKRGMSWTRRCCACSMRKRRSRSRSEEHTSELQSPCNLVCRLLLEKKKENIDGLKPNVCGPPDPEGHRIDGSATRGARDRPPRHNDWCVHLHLVLVTPQRAHTDVRH